MFSDPLLAFVNLVLIVGILLALIASSLIDKGNRKLRAANRIRKLREEY